MISKIFLLFSFLLFVCNLFVDGIAEKSPIKKIANLFLSFRFLSFCQTRIKSRKISNFNRRNLLISNQSVKNQRTSSLYLLENLRTVSFPAAERTDGGKDSSSEREREILAAGSEIPIRTRPFSIRDSSSRLKSAASFELLFSIDHEKNVEFSSSVQDSVRNKNPKNVREKERVPVFIG